MLERVLLVIAGGQNLFCFFWLRYQAIISCNYFESCYRWISKFSVLNRIHYSNAGSSLLQRGGHGRCRPPHSRHQQQMVAGKAKTAVGSACQSRPAAVPRLSHPARILAQVWPWCPRGAGLESCGELGAWVLVVSIIHAGSRKPPNIGSACFQARFGYVTA